MLSVRPGSSRVMSRIAVKLKLLRLAVGLFLALSIVCLEAFSTGQVGYSAEWKDGKSFVSAGSDPATLALATVALLIFVLVIRTKAEGNITGVPTLSRRFVAFLIDFWFSVWMVSSFAAIIPLWIGGIDKRAALWCLSIINEIYFWSSCKPQFPVGAKTRIRGTE